MSHGTGTNPLSVILGLSVLLAMPISLSSVVLGNSPLREFFTSFCPMALAQGCIASCRPRIRSSSLNLSFLTKRQSFRNLLSLMTTLPITRLNFPLLTTTFQMLRPLLVTFYPCHKSRHPILSFRHRILLSNQILILVLLLPPPVVTRQ